MANSNVRFYKLEVLPNFDVSKQGIFVHVTKPMYNTTWTLSNKETQINPKTLWMEPEKSGGSVERINLVKWLSTRHITEIASGLWFGGENGWELLSNETNSGAINDAITAKIATLVAGPYAQAEINTTTNSSTLTIKGIKEANGIIGIPVDTENRDLNIAIDGVYDETDNKIATESTVTTAVTTAINNLDVNTIQAVTTASAEGNPDNTVLTFKGVKETNGKIEQGDGATTFIVGDAKLKIQIGSNEAGAFEVFSANATVDSTIKLDGNVFTKNGDVISVITPTAVASDNRLVTEKDVANLAGAMHYKGTVSSLTEFQNKLADSDAEEAGDVYIATGIQEGSFIHNGNTIENGDMIVFNSASEYKVVQSNITLGTGDGQIAANVGALEDGKLVVGVNSETGKGIKTVEFDVTNLTGETGKNERNLTLKSQLADRELQSGGVEGVPGLYHSVGITDTFTIMGRNMSKSFSISSRNRSISIEKVGDVNSTDAQIDLIWNTVMDA